MSVFNYPTITPPTAAQRIAQSGSQALMTLANTRIQNFRAFWADPINIAAQFGTNATALFQTDAALVAFLGPQLTAAGAPASVIAAATAGIPPQWSVQYNADGSVTVAPAQGSSSSSASSS